ncbi:hypothetical protein [Eleftheria terrae]|uniref:hypothetical protein n=1 Tax=Eleftheria terrae TaxID=1597781 RepID=UPI00263A404D|nr:hypothetical protein [Eleftheria terrae]WKB52162.1 hypothetical protein N7L95_20570 [Eleftheria terrae]
MSHLPGRRLRAMQLPLAAACALVVHGAPALANPYYLYATQEFAHDSNLFRERDGRERSDTRSSTGVTVGVDEMIGRQRLIGSALVRRNLYRDQDQLNNTEYGVNLRADLETINRLSGGLRYSTSRRLAKFETSTDTARSTERNLLSLQDFGARAQLGMASLWVLEGGYSYRDQEYSAKAYESLEQKTHTVNAGARYRPSDLISFGVALRNTKGRIPHYRPGVEDEYDRKDLDFTVLWKPNGLSTLDLRLSRTKTDHDVASARDFTGFTGSLAYGYQPTGKLRFNVNLVRETNDESSAFEIPGLENFSIPLENTRLIHSLRLGTSYDATAKIRVSAGLRYTRRNIEQGTLFGGTQKGSDRTTGANLGINYAFSRNWLFGCNLGWEKRKVGDEADGISFPFKAETASCLAQFMLQ